MFEGYRIFCCHRSLYALFAQQDNSEHNLDVSWLEVEPAKPLCPNELKRVKDRTLPGTEEHTRFDPRFGKGTLVAYVPVGTDARLYACMYACNCMDVMYVRMIAEAHVMRPAM